jgi:type III restriction enzyme
MKLKFKHQPYQAAAVQAVVDIFQGQPPASNAAMSYRLDPGNTKNGMGDLFAVDTGFKNAELTLSEDTLREHPTGSASKTCRCRRTWSRLRSPS